MRISDWSSDVCSSDLQLGGIGTALVAQRVEAGGDEQGRRQARGGEVDRRCAVIRGVGGILVAEPFHPALGQQMPFLEIAIALPVVMGGHRRVDGVDRSEEHTSELQSLMRISYAVFCLKKQNNILKPQHISNIIRLNKINEHII